MLLILVLWNHWLPGDAAMSDGGGVMGIGSSKHLLMGRDILPRGPLGSRAGISDCLEATEGIQVLFLYRFQSRVAVTEVK